MGICPVQGAKWERWLVMSVESSLLLAICPPLEETSVGSFPVAQRKGFAWENPGAWKRGPAAGRVEKIAEGERPVCAEMARKNFGRWEEMYT